jgi:serine/threonine protein kinase
MTSEDHLKLVHMGILFKRLFARGRPERHSNDIESNNQSESLQQESTGSVLTSHSLLNATESTPIQDLVVTKTGSTVPSTYDQSPLFSPIRQSLSLSQTSGLSQAQFHPISEVVTYQRAIGKFAVLCSINDRQLKDQYEDILKDLALELREKPIRNGWDFDFDIKLYMAGVIDSDTKTPHLFVTCGTEPERATIALHCKDHGELTEFLDKHGVALEVFVGDAASKPIAAAGSYSSTSATQNSGITPTKCRLLVPIGQQFVYGLTVEIRSEAGTFVCHCTLGGLVVVGSRLYGWTARHCLGGSGSPLREPESDSATRSTQNEFDGKQVFDVDVACPTTIDNRNKSDGFDYDWLLVHGSGLMSWVFSSRAHRPLASISSTLPERIESAGTVSILLQGSSNIHGTLNTFPAAITLGNSIHHVKIIVLEQPLPKGSSGAWVSHDEQLCGFVIAVQKEPTWAYMIPIREAFRDVRAFLGDEVRVATTEDLDEIFLATSKPSSQVKDVQTHKPQVDLSVIREELEQAETYVSLSKRLLEATPNLLEAGSSSTLTNSLESSEVKSACVLSSETASWQRDSYRTKFRQKARNLFSLEFRKRKPTVPLANGLANAPPLHFIKPEAKLFLLDGHDFFGYPAKSEDTPSIPYLPFFDPINRIQPDIRELGASAASRSTSVAETHSGLAGLELPRQTTFRLIASFNDSRNEYLSQHMFRSLGQRGSFREITNDVEAWLRHNRSVTSAKAYIGSGTCSLFFGDARYIGPNDTPIPADFEVDGTTPSGRLFESTCCENEFHWITNVPSLIHRFFASFPNASFHLRARWNLILLSHRPETPLGSPDMLFSLLRNNRRKNWQNQSYVPQKALRNIMSPSLITYTTQSDRRLSTIIRRRSRPGDFLGNLYRSSWRLTAAVISSELPMELLVYLVHENIDDTKMPLNSKMRPPGVPVNAFEKLISEQFAFIAVTFGSASSARPFTVFSKETIIPLHWDLETDRIGYSRFGDVFKINLNPEHHNFDFSGTPFALKRFARRSQAGDDDKSREERMFRNLTNLQHDHLVVPLTSWHQNDFLFMLFPLASSNLSEFLKSTPAPSLSRDATLGFLKELKAIADGLRLIHNFGPAGLSPVNSFDSSLTLPTQLGRGRHLDIKPDNILVFHPPGDNFPVFKISDFGAARICQTFSGLEGAENTELVRIHNEGYGAPDVRLGYDLSCPSDIWSLGCVFLELLVWLCEIGPDHEDIANARREIDGSNSFWHYDKNEVFWKPVVARSMRKLQEYAESRGVFEPLVELVQKMLAVQPLERPTAAAVTNAMDALLLQATIDLSEDDFYLADRATARKVARPPNTFVAPNRIATPPDNWSPRLDLRKRC